MITPETKFPVDSEPHVVRYQRPGGALIWEAVFDPRSVYSLPRPPSGLDGEFTVEISPYRQS